ncbi:MULTISPECIES: TRAP transporter permease [Halomonas]|uniref:TRAP transporter permease n=1 Tax=Halomonas TaxID=2745 RepID=UPI001A8C190C|nr:MULTISPECIES: TRAP transporter fused permease subunit [Halomonas]MBN8412967.1 TRAP transporter fused permease subunit [Halomonas litopenaei]MBY5968190.1 TRAP transporter fused permease subunit [Halomonas denitrificans]MBY5983683.1 TRAP transporter fused permease subunit [Halomonas sp. DP5Y7-2]
MSSSDAARSATDNDARRTLTPVWVGLGTLSVVFHLGLIFHGLTPALISRPLHMALVLPWVLVFSARTRWQHASGLALTALGVAACLFIVINEDALSGQYGFIDTPLQMAVGVLLIVVALEAARRAIGWPLPLVTALALGYAALGQYLPGEFGHPGLPMASLVGSLTIAEGGLWGKLTGVSVSVVAIFVIFGAVLNAGDAGRGFMNLAGAAAGRLTGGGAKVSVISSALMGSISGSASANVASTGAITIPSMARLGYPRSLAGAVEAVASSGGQIMPPLMGAGAFVMVELTGTPYTEIMGAALLPAFLYFATVWIGINAFATRHDLKPVAAEDRPALREVVTTALFFAVPFAILLERIFHGGNTPQYAASVAIFAGLALLAMNAELKVSGREFRARLAQAALTAGRQIAVIGAIILCASLVIGVLALTGLGVKVTSAILSLSGGQLWPALLLTALACLVLGMEVPTTAAYVICVSVAGPALTELGLPLLTAHLFVFWFALLSTITPPVCGAVFIAAGMADENWLKVAAKAMALGVGLYLIPLAMVAHPALLDLGGGIVLALGTTLGVLLGLGMTSYGLIGRFRWWVRLVLVALGLGVIFVPWPVL